MSDLIDTPLSADEVWRLPDKLRRRYWAAEISHGVEGLCALNRQAVRKECRDRLAWLAGLTPGIEARYVGFATELAGKRCQIIEGPSAMSGLVPIAVKGIPGGFGVAPDELEPA